MRFEVTLSMILAVVFAIAGCESSSDVSDDILEKEKEVTELRDQIKAAEAEKQKAIETASVESRKEAEEKLKDLNAKLAETENELEALRDRGKYEGEMIEKLDDMDRKIDRLEEQADNASGDREIELRKKVAGLKTKQDQLREKLTELRAASGDTWATVKQETEEAWSEASTSLEDAMKDIESRVEEKIDDISSPDEGDDASEEGTADDSSVDEGVGNQNPADKDGAADEI